MEIWADKSKSASTWDAWRRLTLLKIYKEAEKKILVELKGSPFHLLFYSAASCAVRAEEAFRLITHWVIPAAQGHSLQSSWEGRSCHQGALLILLLLRPRTGHPMRNANIICMMSRCLSEASAQTQKRKWLHLLWKQRARLQVQPPDGTRQDLSFIIVKLQLRHGSVQRLIDAWNYVSTHSQRANSHVCKKMDVGSRDSQPSCQNSHCEGCCE